MKRNPIAKKVRTADCQVRTLCRAPCMPSGGAIPKTAMVPTAAKNFVRRFGANAPAEARKRAEELQRAGKEEDYNVWMLICEQAKFLVKTPGEEIKH